MLNVVVTGGAGRIAYALIPLLCDGSTFGDKQISLRLLDIQPCKEKLVGVKMEIDDCCFPRVLSVLATVDPVEAFTNADVVVILGGFPRQPGMERKDLIRINAEGMKLQAEALNNCANADCKVLIVANPCNTNCLVFLKTATRIPSKNFTCLTRLDQERLHGFIVQKLNETQTSSFSHNDVRSTIIWGNHSNTQVPDVASVEVRCNGSWKPVTELIDSDWLYTTLIPRVQARGAEIIKYQNASSGMSAANAIMKHLKSWLYGSPESFSMGIHLQSFVSNDSSAVSVGVSTAGEVLSVPTDLVFSVPCVFNANGDIEIKAPADRILDDNILKMLRATADELIGEWKDASSIVGSN